MRRAFKLENLSCANCAAKMEMGIGKLEGVEKATISFMTQRLVIEADEASFPAIIDKAQAVISGIEPDCLIKR